MTSNTDYAGIRAPSRPYLYLPDGWDSAWQAAVTKLRNRSAQVPVAMIGHSWVQGYHSTDWNAGSFAQLVESGLKLAYGDAGRTFMAVDTAFGSISSGIPANNALWSYPVGSWALWDTSGGMVGWPLLSTTASAQARFTPPSTLTFPDFDLIFLQDPTGTAFTVNVDGTPTNPDQGAGAMTCLNASYARHYTLTWSNLPKAAHVIDVIGSAGTNRTMLAGITVYPSGRGAPGVLFHRIACGGRSSFLFWPGWVTQNLAYLGYKASVEDFNPALVIICLGVNDCNQGYGTDILAQNYANACLSAQTAGASVLFLVEYCGSGLANQIAWARYIERIRNVAHAFNAAVIDLQAAWAQSNSTFMYSDNIHPNDAGHADIAARILGVL